ncbi:MAG: nicotinate phosphoribosyltransferase, partial [Clostridia bacterium]|nr:nicotinate phosphoribosyltransferase [Clostridia bacterium]
RWMQKTITNFHVEELYVDVFVDGKQVYTSPDVYTLQANCQRNLDRLWPEYRRLSQPHNYKVDLSDKLYQLKQTIIAQELSQNK